MKKLTPNQQQYRKEIRRIRTNLSKLRKQGYDVSELANRYSYNLPKRVTAKKLRELHSITPKKLKAEVNYVGSTPAPRTPLTVKPDQYKTIYAPSTFPKSPVSSDYENIPVLPDEETFYETPESIDTEPEETQTEEREIEYTFDEETGKGYTRDKETGEIIDEEELNGIIDDEGFTHYFGMETGMYYGRGENVYFPEMDKTAYEMFEQIINSFPMHYSYPMMNALNKMIDERGFKAVADALTQSIMGRPNVLEKLSTTGDRYDEARTIIEEVADILDVPINLKEEIKDYVYREQMSDIEKYGT